MICPKCGNSGTGSGSRCVTSSVESPAKTVTRRRRCPDCDHKWHTLELSLPDWVEIEYPVGYCHKAVIERTVARRIVAAVNALMGIP